MTPAAPDTDRLEANLADVVNTTVRAPAPPRLVVGISGASGVVYGARVLDALREVTVQAGQDWTILHDVLRREGRLHFETY